MVSVLKKTADFTVKMIIMFMTLLSIIVYAEKFGDYALVFGFLGFLFVLAIIVSGLSNIFSKE